MATQINQSRARRVMQAGALIVALGAGYTIHEVRVNAQNGGTTTPPAQKAPVVATQATRDAAATQTAFVDVAQAVQPAVVTIVTRGARPTRTSSNGGSGNGRTFRFPSPFGNQGQGQGEQQGADPNSDFQQFFKKFQRDFGLQGQSYEPGSFAGRIMRERALVAYRKAQDEGGEGGGGGLGSGMIYRADGLILTNAHVVRGANTVSVTLSDGRKFDNAKVLGRDERTDIAVVKLSNVENLPTVKLGDSDDTRVGDWAIAVGNPFGLDHTLTVGVISARARELNLAINKDTRTDYLQTDASINPGNSGGPLLDIYGRVIGVNNAIYSESGGNQGIGFAIPINTARAVADQLATNGRVRRGYLGVSIKTVEDVAAAYGLDSNLKGVIIEAISDPNGPGAKAGLKPGDVVTKFNGKAVTKSSELQRAVGNAPIGSTITLDVVRSGKTIQLSATTQELKDAELPKTTPGNALPDPGATNGTASAGPGLKTRNLSPDVARALGIKATRGVVVTQVDEGSPADDAGLVRGDVIEQVGQTPVGSVAEMNSQVGQILGRQSAGSKKVALFINRGGERQSVIIAID